VSPGDTIDVEKLPYGEGEQVEFDEVLLVANGGGAKIGQPLVEGATVKATVLHQGRHRKVLIYKYRASKRYRRKKGHRQPYTRLRIDEIVA
jgi:large subunit ribosomal protein L21